jgi:hypothetical protein
LRHYDKSRKVTGSTSNGVIYFDMLRKTTTNLRIGGLEEKK